MKTVISRGELLYKVTLTLFKLHRTVNNSVGKLCKYTLGFIPEYNIRDKCDENMIQVRSYI
jgi:hypothetical protein